MDPDKGSLEMTYTKKNRKKERKKKCGAVYPDSRVTAQI